MGRKEKSMKFSERMQEIINKGVATSKDLLGKAGEKAKELGAMGVLRIEILQLQSHAEKLIAKLGNEVYMALVDKNQASVGKDAEPFKAILKEIEDLRDKIEKKEKEFRAVGGKEEALKPVDKE
jgi:secreted PhoX family phosphatase